MYVQAQNALRHAVGRPYSLCGPGWGRVWVLNRDHLLNSFVATTKLTARGEA